MCARNNLRLIQIGRDVNVCRADELVEFLVGHETIIKYDAPFRGAPPSAKRSGLKR